MGKVFEIMLDAVLLILIVASMFASINACSSLISANEYLNGVAETISASNINPEVVADCVEEATNDGYQLTAEIINEDNYTSRYAKLKLTYTNEIPLFSVTTSHEKWKVAR